MKGAIVLSTDAGLVPKLRDRLRELSLEYWDEPTTGELQVHDPATGLGFYFSLMEPGSELSYTEPPHYPEPGVAMPDFTTVYGYDVDCRSEEFFVRMLSELAGMTKHPIWVLDESDVLWDARNVDPGRVHL